MAAQVNKYRIPLLILAIFSYMISAVCLILKLIMVHAEYTTPGRYAGARPAQVDQFQYNDGLLLFICVCAFLFGFICHMAYRMLRDDDEEKEALKRLED